MKLQLTYQPGGTVLHKLHPLIKLGWVTALTGLLFLAPSPWVAPLLTGMLLLAFPLLGFSFDDLRGFRLLLVTALLIALLQVVFLERGSVVLVIGPLSVTDQALLRGVYLGTRFLVVILLSYLFVLTTSPNQLAYALMRAGLPYRFGFTLVTALRLIPIFEEEALTVYRAQLVRGVSYRQKKITTLIKAFRMLLLPMLISAMSKVDALAVSMEGRCFGRYPTRTYYKQWERSSWNLVFGVGLGALVVFTSAWMFLEGYR